MPLVMRSREGHTWLYITCFDGSTIIISAFGVRHVQREGIDALLRR